MLRMVVVLPTPFRPSRLTHSPAGDLEGDAEEDLGQAVGGVEVADPQEGLAHACFSPR